MGATEELRALTGVVNRLAEKFPQVPKEQIEDVVQQEHRSLDSGRVRDFVPLLVEHAARDGLALSRPLFPSAEVFADGKTEGQLTQSRKTGSPTKSPPWFILAFAAGPFGSHSRSPQTPCTGG